MLLRLTVWLKCSSRDNSWWLVHCRLWPLRCRRPCVVALLFGCDPGALFSSAVDSCAPPLAPVRHLRLRLRRSLGAALRLRVTRISEVVIVESAQTHVDETDVEPERVQPLQQRRRRQRTNVLHSRRRREAAAVVESVDDALRVPTHNIQCSE